MQSWTTQASKKVGPATINKLTSGKRPLVKLTTGWKFRAYKARSTLTIVAPGTMTILQDNVKNVYSRIS